MGNETGSLSVKRDTPMADQSTVLLSRKFRNMYNLPATLAITQAKCLASGKCAQDL